VSPSRPSPRGTSLIEAMAALVVFSIGIIGVMQMNVLASQQNNLARSQTTASKIARDLADAFERIPYNHPLLATSSTLAPDSEAFVDFDNPDGRWLLEEISSAAAARPLLGAAEAIMQSEGNGTFYQVAWRARQLVEQDPNDANRQLFSRRIAIMVRYPSPGMGFRQVTVWAIKFNPQAILGDDNARDNF
jgi:hypothetical protein